LSEGRKEGRKGGTVHLWLEVDASPPISAPHLRCPILNVSAGLAHAVCGSRELAAFAAAAVARLTLRPRLCHWWVLVQRGRHVDAKRKIVEVLCSNVTGEIYDPHRDTPITFRVAQIIVIFVIDVFYVLY
jgi:hypothetical protein